MTLDGLTDCEAIVEVLDRVGERGITTWPLMMATEICNITGRISDLRGKGYVIRAEREPQRSRRGKTVFRYVGISKPDGSRFGRAAGSPPPRPAVGAPGDARPAAQPVPAADPGFLFPMPVAPVPYV